MIIQDYLRKIDERHRSGISREHAYRADLEGLIRELAPGVEVTNEPANVTDSGNPDFVITRSTGGALIPIGYIEAKAVGAASSRQGGRGTSSPLTAGGATSKLRRKNDPLAYSSTQMTSPDKETIKNSWFGWNG